MGKKRKKPEEEAPASPAPPSALRHGLPPGIALAVLIAFCPALGAGFVNWDDDVNLTDNPSWRGLGSAQLKWMWTTFLMGHYQPLTWMSFGLDHALWGMNPRGYHLTSLLLHAANSVLLYFVVVAILRRVRGADGGPLRWAAAAGALFYGLHPLRVESVAWVTERRDVLCGFFLLLAVLAYLRMTDEERPGRWLALSCACFAASLLSKGLGLMLPFVLVVLDLHPLRRFGRRALLEKIPFLALSLAYGIVMLLAMSHIGAVRSGSGLASADRPLQAGYGLWFYAWKTLVPAGLHPFYALEPELSLWRAEFVGPTVAAISVTALLVVLRRRFPAGLAAWAAFGLFLVPVLGLVVTGYQRAADRYTYLSCLPFSLLLAAGLAALPRRDLAAAAAAGLLLLGQLTFRQAGFWHDSIRLWTRVLEFERRFDRPWVNRGAARLLQGDRDGALADTEEAIRVNPSADAFNNRGQLRQDRKDYAGALQDYDRALELDPKMGEGWNNRAALKVMLKDYDGALADTEQAFRLGFRRPETHAIRGQAKALKGDLPAAIAEYEEALRLATPDWPHRRDVQGRIETVRRRLPTR